jgi:hypothetical protein
MAVHIKPERNKVGFVGEGALDCDVLVADVVKPSLIIIRQEVLPYLHVAHLIFLYHDLFLEVHLTGKTGTIALDLSAPLIVLLVPESLRAEVADIIVWLHVRLSHATWNELDADFLERCAELEQGHYIELVVHFIVCAMIPAYL